jgi:predicted acyltransferase
MLYMASEMWRLPALARNFPDNVIWQFIAYNTSHIEWTGGSLWDMIQPSFTFMVGVALPWSVANRRAKGQGMGKLWIHAVWRALLLVLLGIFLRSVGRTVTNFTFEDVLTQIGLGYPILFLLAWTRPRVQAAAAVLLLIGYWAAFAAYPLPEPGFDTTQVGVKADWPHHQTGFAAHWDKNTNFAAANDRWFLNLFPREKPFRFNGGGYQTLSFIPSLATMIFGLLAGELLRGGRTPKEKLKWMLIAGAAGLAAGWALGALGVCPVVKRIWTPSWTLASGGVALWFLAGFYWLLDVRGNSTGMPLVRAVGMNSIAMYVMAHLWDRFLAQAVTTNFGWNVLKLVSEPWVKHLPWLAAWAVLWWVCVWMDRRKLYVRI